LINFKNSKQEEELNYNGFVVVDVFEKDEVAQLLEFYQSKKKEHLVIEGNTHNTIDVKDPELARSVDKRIKEVLIPKLNGLLSSYDIMLSSYMIKEAGRNNNTAFHQDPTLIAEKDKISANIWIALQDTTKENGCLQFVKGSHRFGDSLVVTPNFPTVFEKYNAQLPYFLSNVLLKSGQGVIFDNKLIHSANPNHSNTERIAIVAALKSDNCDWVYYYKDPESGVIEKYNIDYEAYLRYPKGKKPNWSAIGQIQHEFEQKTYGQFLLFMFKNFPRDTIKHLIAKLFKS